MELVSEAAAESDEEAERDEETEAVEEAAGAEEDGGAGPDITAVAAVTTVLVIYIVDVRNVVEAPASEGSAKVSCEEERMTRVLRRGFKRRIARALWSSGSKYGDFESIVWYIRATCAVKWRRDAANGSLSDANGDLWNVTVDQAYLGRCCGDGECCRKRGIHSRSDGAKLVLNVSVREVFSAVQ